MTRKQILKKIATNNAKINELKKANILLDQQQMVMSDKKQWYKEEEVEITVSRRPKVTKTVLRGIVFWYQWFKDEGTGKSIKIERYQVVKEDGQWVY